MPNCEPGVPAPPLPVLSVTLGLYSRTPDPLMLPAEVVRLADVLAVTAA